VQSLKDQRGVLLDTFKRVRANTESLAAPLSAEDQCIQSMPDVSPTKWHRAHTTWFWETFLLKARQPDYTEFDAEFCFLFNSYYEQVGARHPRHERGFLSRPSCEEVGQYRAHVDAAVAAFFDSATDEAIAAATPILRLGFAHEEQHQELLLMDIKHVLSMNPCSPRAYPFEGAPQAEIAGDVQFLPFEGGLVEIGHAGDGFSFDNETPRHKVWLEPFSLADQPVTNGDYQAFIDDGGYSTATLWLSDGWAKISDAGWTAPLYWRRHDDAWLEFTLHGDVPLDPGAPVCHLSYYEAQAFAEWAGARLPGEAEWEQASKAAAPEGRFMVPGQSAQPGPSPAGEGLKQMFGGVWEWTRSDYAPYPGFRPPQGAVGEYNGKFMSGQNVLRGGSCATPSGHVRATYRNFFPPDARWAYSGLRLARDI